MKNLVLRIFSLAVLCGVAGCAHLDVTAQGNPDRVLRGTVTAPSALPAGAEIVVRLIDVSPAGIPRGDLPIADRPTPVAMERVLAEHRQTLATMKAEPVPFEVTFRADDTALRHGLNVDVRISYGGRLRFRTISAHVLTLASSHFSQDVAVQPLE